MNELIFSPFSFNKHPNLIHVVLFYKYYVGIVYIW